LAPRWEGPLPSQLLASDLSDAADVGSTRIRRAVAVGAEGGALDGDTSRRIEFARGRGTPLSDPVRARMEPAFGADLSDVRVHDDAEARHLSRRIQARAFTVGQDIFLGADRPDAATSGGQHLLADELAHTVQQSSSRIRRGVVRREFVDLAGGDITWQTMTTKIRRRGPDVGRSRRLVAVDNALATARTAYRSGSLPNLQTALQANPEKRTKGDAARQHGRDAPSSATSGLLLGPHAYGRRIVDRAVNHRGNRWLPRLMGRKSLRTAARRVVDRAT